jgi:flavin-dependent dehydrogenase
VHKVRDIRREGDGYVIDDAFRCRFLIGAGGTRCPVHRAFFRELQPHARALQAVTLELEYPCNWNDADCHLWFLEHRLPGYAWYVPKADGYLNVGVGAMAARLASRGGDIRAHWRRLVDKLIRRGLINEDPGPPGGYSYFLRGPARSAAVGNAFAVGDAAGLATRDMCEGIGPAVRSGIRAAEAILQRREFALDDVSSFTSGNRLVSGLLAYAFTG